MSTSPIIPAGAAPASYASPGNPALGSSDSADFHKVLQEVSSGDSESDNSSTSIPDSSPDSPEAITHGNDQAVLRRCSTRDGAVSKETSKVASASTEHYAKQEKDANGKILSRSKSKTASSTADEEVPTITGTLNFHLPERLPPFETCAKELNADSSASAPADASAMANGLPEFSGSIISAAAPSGTDFDSSISKLGAGLPDRFQSNSSGRPLEDDSESATSFTPGSIAVDTPLAKASQSRMSVSQVAAKAQATTLPERTSDIAEDTQSVDAGNIPPTHPQLLTHDLGVSDGGSAVVGAALVPNATVSLRATDSHSSHSHSQTGVLGNDISDEPERTNNAIVGGRHDSGTGSPGLITHVALDQIAAAQPATTSSAHGANADATQSPSAVLAAHAQSSAPVAVHPQPKIDSYPIPNPPSLVSSGQLRVTNNSSELKISIQLPELGKVDVRAITSHDVTTAHLTTSHHDALHALVADLSGLEQALRSRDVILGSLNSSTTDSHAQNSHGQSAGQQRRQNSSTQPVSGASSVATTTTTSSKEEGGALGLLPEYARISVRA
ncbi:MAG TPA: flagellar hook-length control protein FliK [Candidatus Saccharimonadales bacterium]|nr:flagellar hook-length control protein FliK [Candidatus Saccharimonadales bacterium]